MPPLPLSFFFGFARTWITDRLLASRFTTSSRLSSDVRAIVVECEEVGSLAARTVP